MVFVIHWHELAMDLHVFPIPIPPPTSLSTRSLWVFPVHQVRALDSCISILRNIRNVSAWAKKKKKTGIFFLQFFLFFGWYLSFSSHAKIWCQSKLWPIQDSSHNLKPGNIVSITISSQLFNTWQNNSQSDHWICDQIPFWVVTSQPVEIIR